MNPILQLFVLLAVIHFGYILVAFWMKRFSGDDRWPVCREKLEKKTAVSTIEHIVCFKNESRFIEQKLKNCYAINYPHIHHTFVNDNSTDDTQKLLEQHADSNTRIITNDRNLGKNQSQIKAVNQSNSDLLLFSDANVFIGPDSVTRLVQRFFDADIGGLCGNVTITTDMTRQDLSGRYWELEKVIKSFQNRYGLVIGFDGGFYCIRRENYYLKRENELSDFESAFLIMEQHLKAGYVTEATAVELERRKTKDSLKVRMRASNRVFWSYRRIFKYIGSLKPVVIVHFCLHKIIRYLFIINYAIALPFLIYEMVSISPLLLAVFTVPFVFRFTIESYALCLGGIIALRGKEYVSWSHKKA